MARPIPRLPPVTSAVLPSSFVIAVFRSRSTCLSSKRSFELARPELSKQLASRPNLHFVGFLQPGIPIAKVETLERQSGSHGRFAVDGATPLKRAFSVVPFV